ncbi:nicotinate phosphoribosyltransferase [Amnibacterium kyonggiense]|uniref:Nicotinate phosphoribosyltransferase n=1 Tax=Amnibacterium kyonggiense TaxID=595671 RepID=A0A4R7FJ96_9MICO|nr:nicotinate phosphoribosyltransferase [Amnibacterium kyonggiense]TDS75936.1 nicotinate phosphoribosyltransferase [Amnibacterium kyonggiense]
MTSTALLTDRYELTMLDAALRDGTALRPSVFEVFSRRLSGGRRYGVLAGTGRVLDAVEAFRFGDTELDWLRTEGVVSSRTLDWLADYRFSGSISGYREGELYFPSSPVLTVEGTFAEGVILETLILSILNADSAIATAAARMVSAAGERPLAEMGSRRTHEQAAVSSSRAAWIAGFSATSNLEAGRTWGVPTMGTAAHAFTLLHDSEEEAFRAQIDAMGAGTTLLVDTYDVMAAIETAVRLVGRDLGAVRIDSGDLPVVVKAVRDRLDELGATSTRITVTNDLDEYAIAALAASPVDSYGAGTRLVGGSGHPTAGFVYKLVERADVDGSMRPVAKKSVEKAGNAGRKWAFRLLEDGVAIQERIVVADAEPEVAGARDLVVPLVVDGRIDPAFTGTAGVRAAREHHARVVAELPQVAMRLSGGDPAIPTVLA